MLSLHGKNGNKKICFLKIIRKISLIILFILALPLYVALLKPIYLSNLTLDSTHRSKTSYFRTKVLPLAFFFPFDGPFGFASFNVLSNEATLVRIRVAKYDFDAFK